MNRYCVLLLHKGIIALLRINFCNVVKSGAEPMKLVLKILALLVVRCKSDLYSWKSAYKCCVLCDWYTAFGYWRLCDLLHCKGFVAVLSL